MRGNAAERTLAPMPDPDIADTAANPPPPPPADDAPPAHVDAMQAAEQAVAHAVQQMAAQLNRTPS